MKIMESSPITSWQIDGAIMETVTDFFSLSKITACGDCSHESKRCLLLGRKAMTNLDSILKSRDITFAKKGPSSQSYGFSSSHVWMWVLDHKESWALKNWWFWTVVLEKTLESPLECRENKPVNSKGNLHWKDWCWSWSSNTLATWWEELTHWKNPGAGKDWWQEKQGMTEDEMVGWHQRLTGHEFK